MGAGLQVFNAKGQTVLDTSTKVWKKLGEFAADYDTGVTSYTDKAMARDNIAIFLKKIELKQDGNCYMYTYPSRFSLDKSTGKVSWTYQKSMNGNFAGAKGLSYVKYKFTFVYGWYT